MTDNPSGSNSSSGLSKATTLGQPPRKVRTYTHGKKESGIKVYTVNQESRHLLVENVPAFGLEKDLVKLVALHGTIEEYRIMDDLPAEQFTEIYWFRFQNLHAARAARRKLDNKPFFGNLVKVKYAPEYETIEDVTFKLEDRRRSIAQLLKKHSQGHAQHQANPKVLPLPTPARRLQLPPQSLSSSSSSPSSSMPHQPPRPHKPSFHSHIPAPIPYPQMTLSQNVTVQKIRQTMQDLEYDAEAEIEAEDLEKQGVFGPFLPPQHPLHQGGSFHQPARPPPPSPHTETTHERPTEAPGQGGQSKKRRRI